MSIADVVSITISTDSANVTEEGFGTPLILSPRPAWVERVRSYEALADMVTDGFTATTPEYLAAQAMFSQNPRPEVVKVGRQALPPTMRWAVTPVVANSTVYKMKVGGTEVSYTSDGSATAAEIIAGLKTLIDALALPITVSDQTTYMRIVENVAGAWHQLSVDDVSKLGVAQDHADPGVATDLAAIQLEDPDWKALVTLANSKAVVDAAAAWVESNDKEYIADSQDSAIITTTISGTDDVAESVKAAGYTRTMVAYHPDNSEFFAAGWLGRVLPLDPGTETWAFKTIVGMAAATLTATHKTNARAKNVSTYVAIAGVSLTQGGKVASGQWFDVIRFLDYLDARIGEAVFELLADADSKVAFTDEGVASVQAEIYGVLIAEVGKGLASDPAPTVTVPKVADVSDDDKEDRNLPDVTFSATLSGAIHGVTIAGVVSV